VRSQPESTAPAAFEAAFAASLAADADPAACAAAASLVAEDGIPAIARLQYYRNNVAAMFEGALSRTYPVLRRRVGAEHFATLVREYRAAVPSTSGDLHWAGRAFPDWLAARCADGDYEWLADLARLEWACEEVLVCERRAAAGIGLLARVAPDSLGGLHLELQRCLRCVSSRYPVWSVWNANQPGEAGAAVDPSLGAQHVVVAQDDAGLVLHSVPASRLRFVEALVDGATLATAIESAAFGPDEIAPSLGWLFEVGLVIGLATPAPTPVDLAGKKT
jgi:hypothetical protein